MPKFLDYHAVLPPIPPDAAKAMAARVEAGRPDPHGVKPLNVFLGDGHGWCLTEAPDADAVLRSHEALGFRIEKRDVHEVRSLV